MSFQSSIFTFLLVFQLLLFVGTPTALPALPSCHVDRYRTLGVFYYLPFGSGHVLEYPGYRRVFVLLFHRQYYFVMYRAT